MPRLKLKVPPPAEVSFERVGKGKATTFSGLCAQHDNDIFRPIDDKLPDIENEAHLFLLVYRAVLRECHAKLQNAIRFELTYQKRIEAGLSSDTEPDDYGMFVVGHLCNAFEFYEYKRRFDHDYLARDASQQKHHVLLLRNQQPSIAVSSVFSLDNVDAPETPRVVLSIFPMATDVAVIFSAIPQDAPFVDMYLQPIMTSRSYLQKYLLSQLVLQSCENFVIDPRYYQSMSLDRRAAICQFFVDTAFRNVSDYENRAVYLF